MSGPRRGRLAALAASAALAAGVVARAGGRRSDARQRGASARSRRSFRPTRLPDHDVGGDDDLGRPRPPSLETTTTLRADHHHAAQHAHHGRRWCDTTTSTSLEVTTSKNVLVPGDGTEGAESTTTTTETPTTISNDDTSDGGAGRPHRRRPGAPRRRRRDPHVALLGGHPTPAGADGRVGPWLSRSTSRRCSSGSATAPRPCATARCRRWPGRSAPGSSSRRRSTSRTSPSSATPAASIEDGVLVLRVDLRPDSDILVVSRSGRRRIAADRRGQRRRPEHDRGPR